MRQADEKKAKEGKRKQSRWKEFSEKQNGRIGQVADWASVDTRLIHEVICVSSSAGGAVRFGYTRDGGAYAIGVYADGDVNTEYVGRDGDVEYTLKAILAFFGGTP